MFRIKSYVYLEYFIIVLIVIIINSCSSKPTWKGSYKVLNGISYISNSSKPVFKKDELIHALTEQFRIGLEEGDSTQVFISITDVANDTQGNMYILVPRYIKKYSSEGKYLNTLGKPGAGPGELNMPRLIFINQKNLVFTYEPIGNRISIFTSDLMFIHSFNIRLSNVSSMVADSIGNVYLASYHQNKVIHKYANDGTHLYSFGEYPKFSNKDHIPIVEGATITINQKDEILLIDPSEYKIRVFDPSFGELTKVISVDSKLFHPPIVEFLEKSKSRTVGGISIADLIVTSDDHIICQYWDRKNNIIITDLLSPEGIFLGRWEDSLININQSDPMGHLLAGSTGNRIIFLRGIPYLYLRVYQLKVPNFSGYKL